MKYPAQQFDVLKEKLPVLLKGLGLWGRLTAEDLNKGTLHNLHYRLFAQLNYPSDNLNVMNKEGYPLPTCGGERLLEIDERFKLYPDGCNDDHIETAMKKVTKTILG